MRKFSNKDSDFYEVEEDNNDDKRDTLQLPHRSLEIRGLVNESLCFETESATPVFHMDSDDDLSSFNPSMAGS